MPECVRCGRDDEGWCGKVAEIGLAERDAEFACDRLRPSWLGTPWLRRIVRRPALHEHGRSYVEELPRDRKPDPGATADTCDEGVATCEVHVSLESTGGVADIRAPCGCAVRRYLR